MFGFNVISAGVQVSVRLVVVREFSQDGVETRLCVSLAVVVVVNVLSAQVRAAITKFSISNYDNMPLLPDNIELLRNNGMLSFLGES